MNNNRKEKGLWEDFTFKGFIQISLVALVFGIVWMPTLVPLLGWLFETSVWESIGLGYLIVWTLFFLLICLFPKIEQRKELKRKQLIREQLLITPVKEKMQIEEKKPKEVKSKNPQKIYRKK